MTSLLELRILEGPNLYFTQAAVKLTLDVTALTEVDIEKAERLARRIGLTGARPGEPGTGFRQRFAARAIARLVRQVAAEAGTHRLAVRVRPVQDVDHLVVAYPWRHRTRAEALAHAVGAVLDGIADADIDEVVSAVARDVRHAEPGPRPTTIRPKIPVVAVTGTNGKTTTSRLIGHMGRAAGLRVGWSSTDGIYADGDLVESGDYSGPSGAGRVLAQPGVQLAVTETARGGILLRGMGVTHNDVSVVTNISADHLGMQGIDTVDQLAEVKSVVPRITRTDGWAVLNGDDPRVLAMRQVIRARPWVFSRDPNSPSLREVVGSGGRATTLIDGWMSVLRPDADADPLVRTVDVPMTLFGLSSHNVENALAAASAALAIGLPREAVVSGLTSFEPGPDHNPGRMNIYSLRDVTVVLDLAHNEAGLAALLEVMHGLCAPGHRTLLGLGTAGDRGDDLLRNLGAIGARGSDVLAIVHKVHYLRGRTTREMDDLYRAGADEVGVTEVTSHESEADALPALLAQARGGDVVGLMCHENRAALDEWLHEQGGSVDSPGALREKVLLTRGDPLPESP